MFKMYQKLAQSLLSNSLKIAIQQLFVQTLMQQEDPENLLAKFLDHSLRESMKQETSTKFKELKEDCRKSCLKIMVYLTATKPTANSEDNTLILRCFKMGEPFILLLIGFFKQSITDLSSNHINRDTQLQIFKSITQLLCEFDSLDPSGNFTIIKDMIACFGTVLQQIANIRIQGETPQSQLLSMYESFFNSFEAFVSGIYRAAQFN